MTLTVDDIDHWDADAVREVAAAARMRAMAALAAADGLADLSCLSSWGGQAAAVARVAIERTRQDLRAHAAEATAVAEAAQAAAEDIEVVQTELRVLRLEAEVLGLEVDPTANRVVHRGGFWLLEPVAAGLLQLQLDVIVLQAMRVDDELAAAVDPAAAAGPSVPGPAVPAPPEDPVRFYTMWMSLSRQQRDELYRLDRNIGNHPGMPAGTEDNPGSDHYNRRHLNEDLARPGSVSPDKMSDLLALRDVLTDPNHKLMLYDPAGNTVHAAVAVGNPDTALHVSVTAPGLNSSVRATMPDMVAQAEALRRESLRQLGAAKKQGEDVATIAWIGYDAPQIPGPQLEVLGRGMPLIPGLPFTINPVAVARSEIGAYQVSHDDVAKAGAVGLARFYDGITAAHGGAPLDLTAIGHSYGSLTTSLALQQPGNHGVDNAIFYGSPGIEATTTAQLGLRSGHVFVMETPDDRVQLVYDAPPVLHTATLMTPGPVDDLLLGLSDLSGTGDFGPNPATNPNFVRLETGPLAVREADGTQLHFDGASGHSEYPEIGSTADSENLPLLRTPGFNIAAVISGLSDSAVRGD